ncbi:MAG: hypothetical protein JXL97_13775 [Bacteroidales bacterium]|nr:hypothetical protein [Bacteroidales bacterium]
MKKYLIVFTFLFLGMSLFSQDTEIWIKNSPEIRMNIQNTPLEVRWRPIDQMIMPDHYFGKHSLVRTDIMFGLTLDKIKIFNYTKFDEFDRFWTGVRFDVNLDFFDRKFLVNIQERFFWGLNDDSDNHYYLVQYLRYGVTPKIHLGILSYGKWRLDRPFDQGEWFVGPSAEFRLPYNFSFHTAFTKQIFTTNVYMWFVRIGYRFKL